MKIVLLVFIVLLTSSILHSQSYFHSGLFSVSGEASFSYSSSEQEFIGNITQKEIKLAPVVSYFFIDRSSVGLEFSYNYFEKSYETFDNKDIEMFIGFGIVAKYYFLDTDISPFVKIGYSYNIYNLTDSYFHNRKSFPGYSAVIGAGLNYFFTNSLALESSLDYVYSQKQIEMGVENGSVFIDSHKKTFKLGIGLLYFL